MDNQYVTIKGVYKDGQINPLSTFLPKGSFQVLITFIEPIDEGISEENDGANGNGFSEADKTAYELMFHGITKREALILGLVQKGYTNSQIAEEMKLGDGTVRNYISSLLDKLKADNRTQLVDIAIQKRLLASRR